MHPPGSLINIVTVRMSPTSVYVDDSDQLGEQLMIGIMKKVDLQAITNYSQRHVSLCLHLERGSVWEM